RAPAAARLAARTLAPLVVAFRLPPRCLARSPPRRPQLHSRPARLGQADGDGLLRGACAVLALAYVLHLLAHQLTRLRARGSAPEFLPPRALDRLSFRHRSSSLVGLEFCPPKAERVPLWGTRIGGGSSSVFVETSAGRSLVREREAEHQVIRRH